MPNAVPAPISHRLLCPEAQLGQRPHAGMNPNTTWSPGATEKTPGPTSITTPAPSWPPMHGGSLVAPARSPVTTCSSLWHIPLAASLTSTSPVFGGSSSISSTLHGVFLSHRIAAFVFTVEPPSRTSVPPTIVATRFRATSVCKRWSDAAVSLRQLTRSSRAPAAAGCRRPGATPARRGSWRRTTNGHRAPSHRRSGGR